ncbi:DNA-binding GntR family transcriptional regulator [Rhizobium azooxidifex]|uniref:DNA-binding GntR family transcriptional regulator n=1 Tax=Mycoplana azooxidifex TaxID=1636188 RepID=A0A7W6D867_9HYPH|nr:GntR family transcriptional regulator [Mycoplana azooxidifex]MBB3978520.1 DNA-binding GntR family transcriptional regulator [Mycoplana azooxidifex]
MKSLAKPSPRKAAATENAEKRTGRLTRPALLVDEVVRAIREMIVEGRVLPGERLSENVLAAELGVSTTPVREAIALLRREGLVTVQPQSGTYVFELQPGELNQLCELRFALEPAAVQLALDKPESKLGDELAAIVEKMERAQAEGRTKDYLTLDTAFHDAIIAASGNPYITNAYALIGAKMAALRNRLGDDPHHMEKSMREHVEITSAIREKDLSRAANILVRHIARKEGSYWEHLDPDQAPAFGGPAGAD